MGAYDPRRHHRRSIRLAGYDYTQPGAYLITVVTYRREFRLGCVRRGCFFPSPEGHIVEACWLSLPSHFNRIKLDDYILMPDHLHGIIRIEIPVVGARHAVPQRTEQFGKPVAGSLPTMIRSFKSAATREINRMLNTPGAVLWQRNYFEHVIRTEKELLALRDYIAANPERSE